MAIVFDPQDPRQIERAVALLRAGTPVALPTETVYGLAAPAYDETALAKIFSLKNRPTFDPLIVHVLDLAGARGVARALTPAHERLIERFWPGPLTLLLEKNDWVPDLCTAGSPWVAVRAPAHPVFRDILERMAAPLAAPSANRFGRISPVRVRDVLEELGPHGLEAIVDGGESRLGLESTVVKLVSETHAEIVRLGSLRIEDVRDALGPSAKIDVRKSGTGAELREAPGQLKSHYAPRRPLERITRVEDLQRVPTAERSRSALLTVYPIEDVAGTTMNWRTVRVLSPSRDDAEAARRLFSTLRELDALEGIERIFAVEARPFEGLNLAINDRLSRASAKE